MTKIVENYHYVNANEHILLIKGGNLMQPPTRPAWGTWGVALYPL